MNNTTENSNATDLNALKKVELVELVAKQDKQIQKMQKKITSLMEERGHASITFGDHLPVITPHGEIGLKIAESQNKMKTLVELGKNPAQKSKQVLALKLGFKALDSAQKAIFIQNTGMELQDGDLEPTKLQVSAKFSN